MPIWANRKLNSKNTIEEPVFFSQEIRAKTKVSTGLEQKHDHSCILMRLSLLEMEIGFYFFYFRSLLLAVAFWISWIYLWKRKQVTDIYCIAR